MKKMVTYEIRNILGNPFIPFFGMLFPILMLFIITKAVAAEVPAQMEAEANTSVFITMSLIIPMAVTLIGYAATYAQELEKGIPMRMKLFGFTEKRMLSARILAQLLVVTAGLILYTAVGYLFLDLLVPRLSSAVCLVVCLYISGVIFVVLGHGLATFFGKFGPTYAVVMLCYFGIMMLCGMMGIQVDQLPDILQKAAYLLPMSYISSDFIDFWQKGSYNYMPLVQAFLFLGAVSGVLLLISIKRGRR